MSRLLWLENDSKHTKGNEKKEGNSELRAWSLTQEAIDSKQKVVQKLLLPLFHPSFLVPPSSRSRMRVRCALSSSPLERFLNFQFTSHLKGKKSTDGPPAVLVFRLTSTARGNREDFFFSSPCTMAVRSWFAHSQDRIIRLERRKCRTWHNSFVPLVQG